MSAPLFANIRCARCDKPAVHGYVDGCLMFPSCPCGSNTFNVGRSLAADDRTQEMLARIKGSDAGFALASMLRDDVPIGEFQAALAACIALAAAREALDYAPLHAFAEKHRVSYNELCVAVRVALSAAPSEGQQPVARYERARQDRPWRDYPEGTKAHAFSGGYWIKLADGRWKWHTGSAFPTPGADAIGACIELPAPPPAAQADAAQGVPTYEALRIAGLTLIGLASHDEHCDGFTFDEDGERKACSCGFVAAHAAIRAAGAAPAQPQPAAGQAAELLAALKLAVDALAGGLWDYGPGSDEHAKCDDVIAVCRAAIAAQQPAPLAVPEGDRLRQVLTAVFRELEARGDIGDGNAPGHAHERPGIWDDDNDALSGKACAWCALWAEGKRLLAAAPAPTEAAAKEPKGA